MNRAIMSMAHEVRSAAANTWGGRPGEYSMSIALEMAWEADRNVKESKMVDLNGSEKQIVWAEKIRVEMIEALKAEIIRATNDFDSDVEKDLIRRDGEQLADIAGQKIDSAKWWIDYRAAHGRLRILARKAKDFLPLGNVWKSHWEELAWIIEN